MVNNKVKTIAELTGLDIPQFRKQMIKILDDCNIKKRPDNNLSDIDWVKEFEIMTAGNYVKWKKTYATKLPAGKTIGIAYNKGAYQVVDASDITTMGRKI